ncbi:TMEM165/GDT1 family protein [Peptoniphilus sp. KCTC 25270]|uniref:TMEM165/GDT1 family protein n=1 Tax=Peptoniphilus sp. KCTC 25270 TaxID=2897414 RepID=UPI001E3B9D84|nr:TMEM165/GDT1 family protein [Peptoniphilus sp. KCTC 25270]MCD1147572.1 TMEM165/GDT1 family protein [Peptoniphilus sp. KCTC 25270]
MKEFFQAFSLIFLAEMGDKSQLLALAFATAYPLGWVLSGVSLGIFLNHGLAILVAILLSSFFDSMTGIQIFAAILFLFFGFKSFVAEFDEEDEEVKESKMGPIFTMAGTFFLGELGDKTQLTAMTLALESSTPLLIFAATVSSMILVSAIGIFVGKLLGKRIPETTMKILAGFLFLYFGFSKLYATLPERFLTMPIIIGALLLSAVGVYFIFKKNREKRDEHYLKLLESSLALCRRCKVHDQSCPRGKEIERLTQAYLGQDIPFIGNIIKHLESISSIDPKKGRAIQRKMDEI